MGLQLKDMYKPIYGDVGNRDIQRVISPNPEAIFYSTLEMGKEKASYHINGEVNENSIMIYGASLEKIDEFSEFILTSLASGTPGNATIRIQNNGKVSTIGLSENLNPSIESKIRKASFFEEQMELEYVFKKFCESFFGEELESFNDKAKLIKRKHLEESFSNLIQEVCVIYNNLIPSYEDYKRNLPTRIENISRQEWICQNENFKKEVSTLCRVWETREVVEKSRETNVARDTLEKQRDTLENVIKDVDRLLNAKVEFLSPKGKDKGDRVWIKNIGNSLTRKMEDSKEILNQINLFHEKAIKGNLTEEESRRYGKSLIEIQSNVDFVINELLTPEKTGTAFSISNLISSKAYRLSKQAEYLRTPMYEIERKIASEISGLEGMVETLEFSRKQLDDLMSTYNGQTVLLNSREVLQAEKLKDEDFIKMRDNIEKSVEAYVEKIELAKRHPGRTPEETTIMMEAIAKDTENIRKLLFDLNTQSGGGDWLKHLDPGTKVIISKILIEQDSSASNKSRIELGYLTKDEVVSAIEKYSNDIEKKKKDFNEASKAINRTLDKDYAFKEILVTTSAKSQSGSSSLDDIVTRENLNQYNNVLMTIVQSDIFKEVLNNYNNSLKDGNPLNIEEFSLIVNENDSNISNVGELFTKVKDFITETYDINSNESALGKVLELPSSLKVGMDIKDIATLNPESLIEVSSRFKDKTKIENATDGMTEYNNFMENIKLLYFTTHDDGNKIKDAGISEDTLGKLHQVLGSIDTNELEKFLKEDPETFVNRVKGLVDKLIDETGMFTESDYGSESQKDKFKNKLKNTVDTIYENKEILLENLLKSRDKNEKSKENNPISIEETLKKLAESVYNKNVFEDTFERFAKDNPNYLAIFGKNISHNNPMRQLLDKYVPNELLEKMENREFLAVFELRKTLETMIKDKKAPVKSLTTIKKEEDKYENLSPETIERLERILMFIEIDCIGKGIIGESGFDNVNRETKLNFLSGELLQDITKLSDTNEKRMEFANNAKTREDLELLKAFYGKDQNDMKKINDELTDMLDKEENKALKEVFEALFGEGFVLDKDTFEKLITSPQDDKNVQKVLKAYREATKEALELEDGKEKVGVFKKLANMRQEKADLENLQKEVIQVMEDAYTKDFEEILNEKGDNIKQGAISISMKIEVEVKNRIAQNRNENDRLDKAIRYAENNRIDNEKIIDFDKPLSSQIEKLKDKAINGSEETKEAAEIALLNIKPLVDLYEEVKNEIAGENVDDKEIASYQFTMSKDQIKEQINMVVDDLKTKFDEEQMIIASTLILGPQGLADLRRYTILGAQYETIAGLIENQDETFMKALIPENLYDMIRVEAKVEALEKAFGEETIPSEIKQIAIDNFLEKEIKPLVEYENILKENILNVLNDENNGKFFDSVGITSIESFKQERDNLCDVSLSEDETKIYKLLEKNGLSGFDCAYVLENKETFNNDFKELIKAIESINNVKLVENVDEMSLKDIDIDKFLTEVSPIILKATLGEDGVWNRELDEKVSSNDTLKEIENLDEELGKLEKKKDEFFGETIDITDESSIADAKEMLDTKKIATYVTLEDLKNATNDNGNILDEEKLRLLGEAIKKHLSENGIATFDNQIIHQDEIVRRFNNPEESNTPPLLDRTMIDRLSQHFDGQDNSEIDIENKKLIEELGGNNRLVLEVAEKLHKLEESLGTGDHTEYMKLVQNCLQYKPRTTLLDETKIEAIVENKVDDVDGVFHINGQTFKIEDLPKITQILNTLEDNTLPTGQKTSEILGEEKGKDKEVLDILDGIKEAIENPSSDSKNKFKVTVTLEDDTLSQIGQKLGKGDTEETKNLIEDKIIKMIQKRITPIERLETLEIDKVKEYIERKGNSNEAENGNSINKDLGEGLEKGLGKKNENTLNPANAIIEFSQQLREKKETLVKEEQVKQIEQEEVKPELEKQQIEQEVENPTLGKEETLFEVLIDEGVLKDIKRKILKMEDEKKKEDLLVEMGDKGIEKEIERFTIALEKNIESLSEEEKDKIRASYKNEDGTINKESDIFKKSIQILTNIEEAEMDNKEGIFTNKAKELVESISQSIDTSTTLKEQLEQNWWEREI